VVDIATITKLYGINPNNGRLEAVGGDYESSKKMGRNPWRGLHSHNNYNQRSSSSFIYEVVYRESEYTQKVDLHAFRAKPSKTQHWGLKVPICFQEKSCRDKIVNVLRTLRTRLTIDRPRAQWSTLELCTTL